MSQCTWQPAQFHRTWNDKSWASVDPSMSSNVREYLTGVSLCRGAWGEDKCCRWHSLCTSWCQYRADIAIAIQMRDLCCQLCTAAPYPQRNSNRDSSDEECESITMQHQHDRYSPRRAFQCRWLSMSCLRARSRDSRCQYLWHPTHPKCLNNANSSDAA